MTRIVLALIVTIVAMACAEIEASDVPSTATSTPTSTASLTPTPTVTPVPRITIAAVGDIMLARSVGSLLQSEGPEAPFAAVVDMLAGADITTGNLESAITDTGTALDKTYTFRAPPVAAEALALAGFDVVAQANNHALDYGREAMLDTLARLAAAGIGAAGAGATAGEARSPVVVERGGMTVAFLAYTDIPARSWEATAGRAGIAWASMEDVRGDVAEASRSADHVAVFFHFGAEGSTVVTAGQRELARAAIDAGATLVLGAHPHVLQEVEEYGHGLIAYSLGNFVFDGFEGTANESAILEVEVGPGGVEGWRLRPVTIVGGLPQPAP